MDDTKGTVDAAAAAGVESEAVSPTTERLAQVEHMFADCAEDPLMQQLRLLALEIAGQEGADD